MPWTVVYDLVSKHMVEYVVSTGENIGIIPKLFNRRPGYALDVKPLAILSSSYFAFRMELNMVTRFSPIGIWTIPNFDIFG